VSPICTVVDPVAKRIVIDPPAGLIDVNGGRFKQDPTGT